jgi:hypothetical protein
MKHRELTELIAYRDGDDDSLSHERRRTCGRPGGAGETVLADVALRTLPQQPPDAWLGGGRR